MPPRKQTRNCAISGCDGTIYARGWCNKHYQRWFKHGDPEFLMREREPILLFAVSETDLAWTAGLFDGEGSISLHFSRSRRRSRLSDAAAWRMVVAISMTSPLALDRVAALYGGKVRDSQTLKSGKRVYRWSTGLPRSEAFLRALAPYLTVKAAQAVIAVEAAEFRRLTPLVSSRQGGHTFPAGTHTRMTQYGAAVAAFNSKGPAPKTVPPEQEDKI